MRYRCRCGLEQGAVHWHFASKIDLFITLLRQHQEDPLHITPNQVQSLFTQLGPADAIKTLVNVWSLAHSPPTDKSPL